MPEQIVFVDEQGNPTGQTGDKLASHTHDTKLHLAFSCYVFDEQGRLLVTQRALSKKVWPGVWTNSVCGHPSPGEAMEAAITRRLKYELSMTVVELRVVLPGYRYKTPPYNGIIENEFCPVYVARASSQPQPNPEEVQAYKWLAWEEFRRAAEADSGDEYSWWCKDQLKQLQDYPLIKAYSAPKVEGL